MKSKTILVAYQDDLWVSSLSSFFHDGGYRVESAKIVSEMIRKVRKGNIHILLLEDEIEGVNACDLVPLLKKIDDKIQVIVISSDPSVGLAKRLRGAGIFYQAMKPVDLEEIKSAVACASQKIEREGLKEGFFPFFIPKRVPA
ncbi:MAG TPA: response regulator [Thermodesulfobacteriota bacterium]|nr:response regulator [Thermodesulfobacteriota bacterium]